MVIFIKSYYLQLYKEKKRKIKEWKGQQRW